MNKAKMEKHREVLIRKHRDLDKKIVDLEKHYVSDATVHQLKKEKLHLREEITQITNSLEDS